MPLDFANMSEFGGLYNVRIRRVFCRFQIDKSDDQYILSISNRQKTIGEYIISLLSISNRQI